MIRAAKKHQQQLFETEVVLATSPYLDPKTMEEILTHMVELFLGVVSAPENTPKVPHPDEPERMVPPAVTTALTGILNLNQGGKLSAPQLAGCKHQLKRLIDERPANAIMTRWVKGDPAPVIIPDHYKNELQRVSEQL